jgi:ectoine hydroxylase-related dioxygenase (phytanoyl-CoA dioxygenase family)
MPKTKEAGDRDPFGAGAQAVNAEKLISTAQERAAVAERVAALRRDGYVILENLMPPAALDALRAELDRLNAATPWGRYEFEGRRTHRVYNLFGKTRAADPFAMNPTVVALAESYFDDQVQLSVGQGMTIYGGQSAQPLHRDDGHYGLARPRPPFVVASLWALDDFTPGNGGTNFVPGSHLREDETPPDAPPTVACMKAGSVLVYDGALWHGGGTATELDARRRAINILYTRPWLRQQENQYLSIPPAELLALPKLMQRLLGYWIYGFTLGVVNGETPQNALHTWMKTDHDRSTNRP